MRITEEDFEAWRSTGVTRAVLAHVARASESVIEEWVGLLDVEEPTEEVLLTLKERYLNMQAQYRVLRDLAEIDLDDIQEPKEEDETHGDASDSN